MGIFTSMPTESPLTVANVRVVSIVPTSTTVQAWVVIATIVDDLVASFASKAYGTGASKTVDKVGANTSITTRIRAAFININVAIASGKTYMKERRKKNRIFIMVTRVRACYSAASTPTTLLMKDAKNMLLEQENSLAAATLLRHLAPLRRIVGNLCHPSRRS